MKIMFMGTSDFAVEALRALHTATENGAPVHDICAVVSQPDRPKGRGYKLTPTPVKQYALDASLDVYTPETLRDNALLPLLEQKRPDCIVVASYGKILPQYVIDWPKFGCVNVHASLLPEYRGAAPINAAIIDGRTETGVTTMLMDAGLDTGDMLLKCKVDILDEDDAGTLHDKLAAVGGKLVVETLKGLENGAIVPKKQVGESSYAHMIDADMRHIDFSGTACKVRNIVRGLSPVPAATATAQLADGRTIGLKIFSVALCDGKNAPCGTVTDAKGLVVACGEGSVKILSLRPDGKKVMSGEDFARGYSVCKIL